MATGDLFDTETARDTLPLAEGAVVLRGFARHCAEALHAGVQQVIAQAPLRRMVTPGGKAMAVAMTNCGPLGWISDRRGYRYTALDPLADEPWPAMPAAFRAMARAAAREGGFDGFEPDACLVNRYEPGTRLSLHQDRDEQDFAYPIVSVSLGLDAVFLFGGAKRADAAQRVRLRHGDVVVWGGPARLRFHGVLPVEAGTHPLTGDVRFNLTFRKAG